MMKYHIWQDDVMTWSAVPEEEFWGEEEDGLVEFTKEEYEYYQTALDYRIGLRNLLKRKYKEQYGKTKESGNTAT